MQWLDSGHWGQVCEAKYLMLEMTKDQGVKVMQMDILCSVAHSAILLINNKIWFIFFIADLMWIFSNLPFMVKSLQV